MPTNHAGIPAVENSTYQNTSCILQHILETCFPLVGYIVSIWPTRGKHVSKMMYYDTSYYTTHELTWAQFPLESCRSIITCWQMEQWSSVLRSYCTVPTESLPLFPLQWVQDLDTFTWNWYPSQIYFQVTQHLYKRSSIMTTPYSKPPLPDGHKPQ